MNWVINKIFKCGKDDFRVRLNTDKKLSSPKFNWPVMWSGEIAGYIAKTGQLERGKITLKQVDKDNIEQVEFPEFALEIYDDVLKEIQSVLNNPG